MEKEPCLLVRLAIGTIELKNGQAALLTECLTAIGVGVLG